MADVKAENQTNDSNNGAKGDEVEIVDVYKRERNYMSFEWIEEIGSSKNNNAGDLF